MLLVEVPWASRVWALPFLSALAPSERYAAKRGRLQKKMTEWVWRLLLQMKQHGTHGARSWPWLIGLAQRFKLLDRCTKLSDFRSPSSPACPRWRPLRTGPATTPRSDREAAHKGRAFAQPYRGGRRPFQRLGIRQDRQLVRQRGSPRSPSLLTRPCRCPRGYLPCPCVAVLIRDPEGGLQTQAMLCTNLEADPQEIVSWFVMRWQLEVTFQGM